MDFKTASMPEQRREIVERALSGRDLTKDEALAMYANPNNWRNEYGAHGCMYVWVGPVTCAPETAQRILRKQP